MSVSALDQLLLSVAGRPPLAARTRDAGRPAHDLLVPFQQRFLFQGTAKHQRKRQHSTTQKPQPALSLRLYGLKKNGWPRTLLAALRVDVEDLGALRSVSSPRRSLISPSRGLASDSKVRLFFDGLLLQAAKSTTSLSRSPWRLPAPLKLVGHSRPVLQVAVDPPARRPFVYHPSVGIPIEREIGLVRSRRKSPRRMSVASKRSRRGSSYEPREASKTSADATAEEDDKLNQHALLRTHSSAELDRVEAAIDAATANAMRAVAAEANAQLSFELMERKANNNTHYAITYGATAAQYVSWGSDADSVELQAFRVDSVGVESPRPDPDNARDKLEALRAENAEQKALIRQLLIENRRLVAQQQQPQQPQWTPSEDDSPRSTPPSAKRKRLSDSEHERQRGVSSVSTVSSSVASLSRRESLTFDVVDGCETFVDHKFDHLVSEITSELAELLSEDGISLPYHSEIVGAVGGGR